MLDGGQMLRVHGANGSGKTSLLRMICGLAAPAAGDVAWRGRPIGRRREEFHRELAYIGHVPALKNELGALENLVAAHGLAGRTCDEREAISALAQAGLRGRERLPVQALSQGQRRRAALARLSLSAGATLWVLDEPFDALDDTGCAWLEALIAAHLARAGVVVLTSHQQRAWETSQPRVVLALSAPAAHPVGA